MSVLATQPALPILYSFRRCPYAMRARMTLAYAGIKWEHREVLLKDKPAAMLAASPKGTVPVLMLTSPETRQGANVQVEIQVIDESIDIMHWALDHQDPDGWRELNPQQRRQADALVEAMQQQFKPNLDKYKYGNKLSAAQHRVHRDRCENQLAQFDQRLAEHTYLLSDKLSFVDIAWFPFVRQFANVDRAWFDALAYPHLQRWLRHLLESELFLHVMAKHMPWQP